MALRTSKFANNTCTVNMLKRAKNVDSGIGTYAIPCCLECHTVGLSRCARAAAARQTTPLASCLQGQSAGELMQATAGCCICRLHKSASISQGNERSHMLISICVVLISICVVQMLIDLHAID
jgi:hypothetical protein